jgi:glycosyltransferase involved in cell wall biosynthesis
MNILHIGKYYPPFMGGIENFMQLLLAEQVKQGCSVKAIVHQHNLPSPIYASKIQSDEIDDVEIIRVTTYGRLLFAPISPSFPYHLNKIIKSFKPDILHIHVPNTSAFWVLFSSLAKKIPWVIHWHSDVVASEHDRLLALAYPFYRPFETALLKKSKAIISTSPDYLNSSLPLKKWKDKAEIIPLALDNHKLVTAGEGLDLSETLWNNFNQTADNKKMTRLLSIGRLTYYKGYFDLINAMQFIPNAQLIIVGHGEQFDQLKSLIIQLNLQDRVYLAGKVDNDHLNKLLQSCHIFCMSSIERTEAFGLVLLEAMTHAKPIVITRVEGSGMNWVTQNNKTALFSEKQNPQDFAEKVNHLIKNPQLSKTLGDNGYQRLITEFNIETICQQTLKLYQSTCHD